MGYDINGFELNFIDQFLKSNMRNSEKIVAKKIEEWFNFSSHSLQ